MENKFSIFDFTFSIKFEIPRSKLLTLLSKTVHSLSKRGLELTSCLTILLSGLALNNGKWKVENGKLI